MALLFRRRDPEDELEDQDETEAGDDSELLPEVPEFAVIVSDISTDGWHLAMVIGESSNPDYYVRAVTVRWPFLIARPARSSRTTDLPVDPDSLSPTGTTPARKLVINWPWTTVEGSVSQLRFLVKRTASMLFPGTGRVTVRVTLKESAWPRRRIVARIKSNRILWNPPEPDLETPETPSDQST
jgi:hypothetical protein